ncbi:MAG: phosphoribosylanthranilate isomerase [Fusobacteriaceae bacterium]|jgi:phosphoribosylanthranilate isomerase|nr:phosphoribosylanthranilate isomerase [Fusobacteriaceae bacterium]MBP6466694.1 phosphoribosylanthranilate isomerase [Fusobacteriaceae bacterium]MBP9597087.1 phosphoribosylanthranilate isomerase [Fusobacteriaceae bacterium]
MKVKICGIRRAEDIEIVNKYLPDFIGFIFVPASKRYVEPKIVAELKKNLDPRIKTVGVFVNESIEKIREIKKVCSLDVIQLHGEETPQFCEELGGRIWKAIRVKDEDCVEILDTYAEYTELLLLDTYVDGTHGGTGQAFDWDLIEFFSADYNIGLAGGITRENVLKAKKKVEPELIDVASGSETNGLKDEEKIKDIIQIIRGKKYE